jgi:hypothetical protein
MVTGYYMGSSCGPNRRTGWYALPAPSSGTLALPYPHYHGAEVPRRILKAGQPSTMDHVNVTIVTCTMVRWFFALLLLPCASLIPALAQTGVGINTTGAAPRAPVLLDIVEPTKGILFPRIALTARNVAAPVNAPADGLLIYNTATEDNGQFSVTPGFYSWDGTGQRWVRFPAHVYRTRVYNSNSTPIVTSNISWSVIPGMVTETMTLLAGDRVEFLAAGTATTSATGYAHGIAAVSVSLDGGATYTTLPNNTGIANFTVDNEVVAVGVNNVPKRIGFTSWACSGYYVVPADGTYTFATRVRRSNVGTVDILTGGLLTSGAGTTPETGRLKVEVFRP